MRAVVIAMAFLALGLVGGCATSEPEGDYKPPTEGSYKSADQVPERAGRTRAESGGSEAAGMRSEGK